MLFMKEVRYLNRLEQAEILLKPQRALRVRAAAPATQARQALTDAQAMQVWLAEHAEVRLPDRYAFWDRFTPEGAAPSRRLLHADGRGVRFAWVLDGDAASTWSTSRRRSST
jgi:hypothetical protein